MSYTSCLPVLPHEHGVYRSTLSFSNCLIIFFRHWGKQNKDDGDNKRPVFEDLMVSAYKHSVRQYSQAAVMKGPRLDGSEALLPNQTVKQGKSTGKLRSQSRASHHVKNKKAN